MEQDRLQVIALMSRKGGSGKSMVAKALASAVIARGQRCLLIDADPTADLTGWHERAARGGAGSPLLSIRTENEVARVERIIDEVGAAGAADVIVIDTAGLGSRSSEELAVLVDHIVTPALLTETDVSVSMQTLTWFVNLRTRVDDPSALPAHHVVVNGIKTRPTAVERALLERVIDGMPILETPLYERPAYVEMDARGPLGSIIEAMRTSRNPLRRGHVSRFREALAEANDLLSDILTSEHARLAA